MKKIFYYFIILISLITYFYAGYTLDKLKQFENIVDISFLENKPNEDFIKNVLQKKQGVKDIIALSNEGEVDILFNNKYEKTKLVKVFGNPKKIFPKENVLYKPYFEKNGVYISNNLAYNTFNKQDIIGSKIFINDKEYIICGIFEDKTSKVIINSNKYDEFDNIKVFFNKTNNIVKDINNFTKLNNSENLHIININ
ncbi:ABC transporter permease, partial [uncultured Tyzzerella sp.]|uniref:ABC transporter permease n=1 Tax=uncultured Tyzzerella sp. TaxID=2321398 RepID=UPI002943EF8B